MRASFMSEQARLSTGALLITLVSASAGLTAGCGPDEVRQHLDETFGSSNNCLFRVINQNLSTAGPLKLDGGKPLTVELKRRREVVDITATTLDNPGKTPLTISNVCLAPQIGRCILDFVRAKVSTEPAARRVTPAQPHDAWERARTYTVDAGGSGALPTLITSVGLAVGANKHHLCAGGAGALGIVYLADGEKFYVETPIDWTIEVKPRTKPDQKHGPKHRSGSHRQKR